MKTRMTRMVLAAAVALSAAAGLQATAQDKPAAKTVTGEVIDMTCYLKGGMKGEGHKACAIACSKAGLPIGILEDRTNQVYLDLGKDMMANKGTDLRAYVGERVRVTGSVASRGGVQGIAPEKVEKL